MQTIGSSRNAAFTEKTHNSCRFHDFSGSKLLGIVASSEKELAVRLIEHSVPLKGSNTAFQNLF